MQVTTFCVVMSKFMVLNVVKCFPAQPLSKATTEVSLARGEAENKVHILQLDPTSLVQLSQKHQSV